MDLLGRLQDLTLSLCCKQGCWDKAQGRGTWQEGLQRLVGGPSLQDFNIVKGTPPHRSPLHAGWCAETHRAPLRNAPDVTSDAVCISGI